MKDGRRHKQDSRNAGKRKIGRLKYAAEDKVAEEAADIVGRLETELANAEPDED